MVLIGFLVALVTLIVSTVSLLFQLQKPKRKQKKYIILANKILFFVCLFGGIISTFYYIFDQKKELENQKIQAITEYSNNYNYVIDKIFSKDFNAADQKLDDMLNENINDISYIKTNLLKSAYYINRAFSTTNSNEYIYYLEETINLLNNLKSFEDIMSDYDRITLNLNLGFSYIFLENKKYNDNLQEIANYLEGLINKQPDFNDKDVFFFLGMFYETKYYMEHNEKYLQSAKNYLTIATAQYRKENNSDLSFQQQALFIESKAAYMFLRSAISLIANNQENRDILNEEIKECFINAVKLYDDIIFNYDFNIESTIYYESLKDQARCYCFLSISDEKNAKTYLEKAYKNFQKYIYMEEEKYNSLDLVKGSYIFLFLDLNQDEIDEIFKRYNNLLQKYNDLSDTESASEVAYELAIANYFLAYFDEDGLHDGKEQMKKLTSKYFDYFDSEKKEIIKSIEEWYKELEKKFN